MSDNEIYLLIKYIKSVLWRVVKRLSYIQDARCLKVKVVQFATQLPWFSLCILLGFHQQWWLQCGAALPSVGLEELSEQVMVLHGKHSVRSVGASVMLVSNDATPFWSVADNITPWCIVAGCSILMYQSCCSWYTRNGYCTYCVWNYTNCIYVFANTDLL